MVVVEFTGNISEPHFLKRQKLHEAKENIQITDFWRIERIYIELVRSSTAATRTCRSLHLRHRFLSDDRDAT